MSNREDSNTLWIVKDDGYLADECNGGCLNEIRPVVELYKCAIDDSCNNSDIEKDTGDNKETEKVIISNNNESKTEVKVPNILKSVSGLIILIGMVLTCVGLNIFIVIKNKDRKKD